MDLFKIFKTLKTKFLKLNFLPQDSNFKCQNALDDPKKKKK